MRIFVGIAFAVLATSVGTGCGGSSSEEDRVQAALEGYFSNLAAGDGAAACENVSGNGQREIIGRINRELPEAGLITCPEAIEKISGAIGPDEKGNLENIEVTDIEITGNDATAVIAGATASPTLIKFGDAWLIDTGFGS